MLKVRLRRMGHRNRPFYRVVVSDSRRVPTGPAVEELGHYDPRTQPSTVNINRERLDYWVAQGAQVSETVRKLVQRAS